MVVWEGQVDVRVSRVNPIDCSIIEYEFCALKRGSCFNVYNSFIRDKVSLLDYYAASTNNQIYFIDIKDLRALAK